MSDRRAVRRRGTHRLSVLVTCLALLTASAAWAQPQLYRIDADRSYVLARTDRAGALGFLGHRHAILASDWTANLCLDPERPTDASLELTVPTGRLTLDSDRAVELAGTGSRPGPDTVADLQRRMLSAEFLDADRFPDIRFVSGDIARTDEGSFAVEGRLTLHGNTTDLEARARLTPLDGNAVRLRAEASARMTDHGIEPERNLGVVSVADVFDIVVELVARPGHARCDPDEPR
jgi:polyisoprenoid-binding protein YceI